MVLAEELRKQNYDVLEAYSGAEALEIARQHRPDLAILDVQLPEGGGIELGKQLTETTQTPFIFLSAYADEELVREASCACALGYLVKPVAPSTLAPAIEVAMARARELRALQAQNANLARAVQTDRRISMAVGIVMERFRKTADEAFQMLRQRARSERRKVTEIASEIVDATESLGKLQ